MNTGHIAKLESDLKRAGEALITALEKDFPKGCEVRCWLMHSQANQSRGTVISHSLDGGGRLHVRLDSRTQQVRRLSVWDCRRVDSRAVKP